MKNFYRNLTIVIVLLTLFVSQKASAQCSIAVTQSTPNICAGSPVTLRARIVNINVGTGSNGSINVSSTYHTDSVRSAVSGNNAVGTNTITVASSTGFAVGQEILIITMVDTARTGNLAGQYEFAIIASIASNTLTLTQNKVNTYNASATLKHQVVRVPQYQNVTITSAGILTCNNWNGTTGGVLAFRATGTINVNASGNITASGKGYRGVAHNTAQYRNANGGQGEGIYGQGFMGAASTGVNGSWNNAFGNGGGGGTGTGDAGGGGGGGYAAVGTVGQTWGGHFGGTGGEIVGATSLARLYLGGAGGEGGADEDGGHPGPGANGGGIVFIAATTIAGTGNIIANGDVGGNGTNNFSGSGAGMAGGGGGAGGSIQIQANAITMAGSLITVAGGNGGGPNGGGAVGGAGSAGRIRIDMPGTIPVTNPVAFQGTFPPITGTSNYTWSTSATTDSIVVSPTTTTTYSVTAVNVTAGCSTNISYQAIVTPLPTAPVTVNGSRCSSGPVSLSATSAAGTTVRWYSTATGGSPIGFGSSFNTPSIATTTTYYAEAIPEALPGDSLSSLRLALGLRKLKTNYTGNAIKLRRSSDNATQIFGFVGNEIDTVAIKTWLGVSTAFVEIIYDQSGFGNNVSQTSTGNQPTFVLNGHNGRPVLRCNTSQFMFNTVNFPTPFSIVTSSKATGATGRVFGGRANNWLHGYWNGARNQFHYDGWIWQGSVTSNMTLPYIYSGSSNGTSSNKVYENGNLLANISGGYTGPNGIVLNGFGNWGEGSNVDIFEVFIYNAVIDDNSRVFVESSMSNKFNIPVSNFVTAGSGCASSRTAAIATISTNAFNLPDSIFGCGDSILVTADLGYSSYAWNGGGATRTKWIKTAGWATCTVTGGTCGGTQVDSAYVNVITNKIAQNDTAICAGVSKQLSVVSNITSTQGQGSLCGTANEGGAVTLTAPSGSVFTAINFASYGTPNGSCGSFTTSGCHATNSLQIVQAACVGNSTCTVLADNSVFGDPCGGINKRLYIQATYGSTVSNVGKVLWSNGDTNATITVIPNTSTTYYCTSTLNGRTCTDSVRITVNPKPVASITPSGTASICSGDSALLTANVGTGLTYKWLLNNVVISGATASTHKTITAGSYRVLVTNTTGCSDTSAATVVSVATKPTATATAATTTTFCTGGSVVVNANTGAGLTYQWLNNNAPIATATNASYIATAAGSYRVLVSNASGCRDTSTAVAVIVNAIPTITASTPAAICGAGTAVLGATASAGTINWYSALTGGTSLATGASFTTPSISATTNYFVDATANGCTTATRTSVAATVNAIPTITASTPAAICGTGTVVLGATASAGTINWYSAATGGTSLATGASFTTPSITATTNYFVDATANGCTTATRIAVAATVNAIPTITASTPAAICGTGTAVLGATASAGIINWYSAATGGTSLGTGTSFTTPSISATTNYFVDATANGCTTSTRTSVAATVNAIPTITAIAPASRCGTGTVVLGAAPSAGTINWYVGATGGTSVSTGASFTTPSIAATTNYFVDATANGCTTAARTSVAATVNPNLTSTVSISSNTTAICGSAPITFTATPTNGGLLPTYQWRRNGANVGTGTNTYVLSGAVNGDSVSVVMTSNATPCLVNVTSNSNGIVLTSSTVTPTVAISANPGTTICNGTSVTFTANATNGGASPSYQWRRNGVNVGTNLPTYTSATLVTNDSISVVLTSNATCISTPTATSAASVMTVNAVPTITASTPANRCGTGTVALGATASAGTINWYSALTGGTSLATGVSFTTPSITATTNYFVDATANGCTTATRTSVAATVNAKPITSAISGRTSVHSDTVETYAVTNTTGSSYVWTILGGVKLTGGTTNSITVDWDVAYTSGMVKVIETNTIGCKGDTVYKPIVSIVPVEFLSFDAKRANERVNLTWVTASEINNSHFEVERSVDNNRFEQVGTVKGNGTTSMMNTYKMVDNIKTIINSNATTVYYRLKQVDYDGEFAYTPTVTVSLNEKGSATAVLNPNPFKDAFTVEVTESAATTAEVYLLDGNGKMVRNFSMELNKGTTAYQLTALNELSSGMYFVRIITASGNSYTIKTIKK